ncbi:MAG: type II toxin-antitoxin system VapC family toxin [Chloroflexi bacterium]|nr:MAG: type II toxin-antitoxin system VapC family toxin [Chloroflexota bacterium]
MPDALLFDTNAAIGLLNGDSQVEQIVDNTDEIFVPVIVIGELYLGAENSGRVEKNLRRVDQFAQRYAILSCDEDTARWYGRIAAQLRSKGRPIPQNDIWIAAIARQHELTLLTRDDHFKQVDGLQMQAW